MLEGRVPSEKLQSRVSQKMLEMRTVRAITPHVENAADENLLLVRKLHPTGNVDIGIAYAERCKRRARLTS